MLTNERKEQLVEVLQGLIQRRSYSGEEKEVAEFIKETALKLGYDTVHVDKYGNVICSIKGKYKGPKVMMDGHIDTVPVDEEKWTKKPFAGDIIDGKIYGRGTSDMKGADCGMLLAGAYLAQDLNREFAGEIFFSGVVHEECFEGVAAREISSYVKPDYVIIGEASQLNLKIGQRGRGEIVVETFGKPAHSANPEKGINAVYKMMEIIGKIKELPMTYHETLGYGILELTDIKSSPYPGASVVPDYCKATFDRRLLVGETKEDVIAPIQGLIDEMMRDDKELSAKVSYAIGKEMCYTGNVIEGERFFPGWLYDENDEFVQAAYKGLKNAGINPEITQYSFCTNGSHYAGEAGIKTIGFGPSRENLAHTIDEYIEIDQLAIGSKGYYEILKSVYKK